MYALTSMGRGLALLLSRTGIFVLAALVGLGLPTLWIWVGSQVQASTAPSWTALAVVHSGLIVSLILIAAFFSYFVARSNASKRARVDWMRGQSEVRRTETLTGTHPLELVIMFAVFIDLIVFVVWFFAFADPGTPVGQG